MYDDSTDFTLLSEEQVDDSEKIYMKYEKDLENLSRELGINLDSSEPEEQHSEQNFFQPPPPPPQQNFQPSPPPPQQNFYQPPPQQQNFYQPPPQQNFHQPQEIFDDENSDSIQDEKIYLLERIRHLAETLEKTDDDEIHLPTVSRNSSLTEIKDAHKTLVQKTNRIRYTELGQSLIMAGARALGTYFDGNNEFCGRKIDLRGLDARLQWKLKHLKPEIADMVQKFCSGWSPHFLTAFELATIIAIHSHETATTMKNDNMYNDMFSP